MYPLEKTTEPAHPPVKKVLVIEDDLCLQTALLTVLRRIDTTIQCVWVTRGEEAIRQLRCERFDLIISDQNLEAQATGMDVWKVAKAIHPRSSFLLMSGMGVDRFTRITRSLAEPPLYLPKPFHMIQCHVFIQKLLLGGDHV